MWLFLFFFKKNLVEWRSSRRNICSGCDPVGNYYAKKMLTLVKEQREYARECETCFT